MRQILTPALALLLATAALAGCAEEKNDDEDADTTTPGPTSATACEQGPLAAPDATWKAEKPRVRVTTSKGAFVVEVETERAPITAGNFLNLTREGFYDGTLFHRVVRDFVIQAGDPLSKDSDPDNDGTGDPGYEIPDEFHPALRHDAVGVLSMANSGPNTGGSQFFVTLTATPHLDDRHSVFARVVQGIDVVRSIGVVQVDENDRPLEPVRIEKAEVVEGEAATYEAQHGVAAHVVVGEKKTEPGRETRFAVILKNTGNVRDRLALGAKPPEGWTCELPEPVVVDAGTARVVFLSVTPPSNAAGTNLVGLTVGSSSGATGGTTLNVTIGDLGREIRDGDKVTANYAGLLPDGRLFDTSMQAVAKAPAQPKFNTTGGFRDRGSYSTFPFTVGSGVIAGFTNLAKTAKEGETVTSYIPAKDAYATGNVYERPLTGRDLIFELEIVRVG